MKCRLVLSSILYVQRIPELLSYLQLSSDDIGDEHKLVVAKTGPYTLY